MRVAPAIFMTQYQIATVGIIILLASLAIIWDIFIWKKTRGNPYTDATISKLTLRASTNPIVGVAIGLGIGVLFGHLFWPQHNVALCP